MIQKKNHVAYRVKRLQIMVGDMDKKFLNH